MNATSAVTISRCSLALYTKSGTVRELFGVLAGTLVTCGRDNVVRVLDLRTFEPRATLRAPGFAVGAVWTNASLGPDERHAAAGAD